MPNLKHAVLAAVAVLVIHAVLEIFNLYEAWVWVDIPMHFIGGFGGGIVALAGYRYVYREDAVKDSLPTWLRYVAHAIIIVGAVALIGILWEWYEFIHDEIARQLEVRVRIAQPSVGDTMADFAMDVLGGVLAFALFPKK